MKSYHLTQEQALEIASNLELAELDITVWIDGHLEFETKAALQAFANAVLDQVLGEPVGVTGEMPGTSGSFTMAAFKSVDVPNNTKLYTPKEQS